MKAGAEQKAQSQFVWKLSRLLLVSLSCEDTRLSGSITVKLLMKCI